MLDAHAVRRIRRHAAAAGYTGASVLRGLDHARSQGAGDAREDDDAQLADGARFAVEAGSGPRA